MQKLNIPLVFTTQSYFSVPKKVRLNSTHYLRMKIHNKKQLENTVTNNSADIDYKYFMKIYRKCISEPYSFLTIVTKLPANNSLRKMIVTDELKTFDDKIIGNQTQYDLDREAAKISSLSSKELEKYKHLTY